MITTVKAGDILKAPTEAVVVPVNCVGVAGAGLAKQFFNSYPEWFQAYRTDCWANRVQPGVLTIYNFKDPPLHHWKMVVNFPTKRHWSNPSRLEDIDSGLNSLRELILGLGVKSITLPALGCGLGGLPWELVLEAIEQNLQNLDCEVVVIAPRK